MYMGYKPDTWLRVEEGTILRLRVYNAKATLDKLDVDSIWFSASRYMTIKKLSLAAITLVSALSIY